uniref:Uncharacterized protein n=1 Tax=Glossina pallidipes TaxID=7398 RepID=A0A1B0A1Y6_GLOPL
MLTALRMNEYNYSRFQNTFPQPSLFVLVVQAMLQSNIFPYILSLSLIFSSLALLSVHLLCKIDCCLSFNNVYDVNDDVDDDGVMFPYTQVYLLNTASEYKSKTLPRIHFDNTINDMSLNEAYNIKQGVTNYNMKVAMILNCKIEKIYVL